MFDWFHVFKDNPPDKHPQPRRYACCNLCFKVYQCANEKGLVNYGGIHQHLLSHKITNKTEPAQYVKQKSSSVKSKPAATQVGLIESLSNSGKVSVYSGGKREQRLKEQWDVCKWILKTNQPFSAVLQPTFRSFPGLSSNVT